MDPSKENIKDVYDTITTQLQKLYTLSEIPWYLDLNIIFNLVLVLYQARPATSLEGVCFKKDIEQHIWKTFLPILAKNFDNYEVHEKSNKHYSYMIFYDTRKVSPEQIRECGTDDYIMGQILGFECPGDIGSDTQCALRYSVNDINFYAEVCRDPPNDHQVQKKLRKFKKIGQRLGLEVTMELYEILNKKRFHSLMTNPDLNLDEIFKFKSEIANWYDNYAYVHTSNLFESIETMEQLIELSERYQKLWAVLAIIIFNDPVELMYPLSPTQHSDVARITKENEDAMYQLWV